MRLVLRYPRLTGRCLSAALCLLLALAAVPRASLAQAAPAPAGSDEEVCLGFSFGPWNPALDWQRAGHGVAIDSAHVPRAPGGRGWAAPSAVSASDTALMLFPTWWPVGVVVELSTRTPAPGDTVSGRAIALVAEGRQEPPTSRVRAWQVPCRRGVMP